MAQNISKFIQINPVLLLEYEFSRDASTFSSSLFGAAKVATNLFGTKHFFTTTGDNVTNTALDLQSVPTNSQRSTWFIDTSTVANYYQYFDASTQLSAYSYSYDTIKIHIVSGYSFEDIAGIQLQIRAQDTSNNLVDLSNFTWIKQKNNSEVLKFSSNALFLSNKFYDKYLTFKVPSIGNLSGDTTAPLASSLLIKSLSNVFISYSTIDDIDETTNTFQLSDTTNVQLETTSVADNFNAYISAATSGDYIEYYATWNNAIIGDYIGDIESGVIRLYTSNNPNDNYQEFADTYGVSAAKWVVMHEIYVYENLPGSTQQTSILSQKFTFTQEDNFSLPNYFRPVLPNADIASSYIIKYICRLYNRMDGSQIIRQASFASYDPKKYGKILTRINVDSYIPYKVFNKVSDNTPNINMGTASVQTKYVKVYTDTTNIAQNSDGTIYPQGTGPLFIKKGDGVYKFKFDKYTEQFDSNGNSLGLQRSVVDLSGIYNYTLEFILLDDTKISISPTYSTNMNTAIGELEFKIISDFSSKLLSQPSSNNQFNIIVNNSDGTSYTIYQGLYYAYSNKEEAIAQYNSLLSAVNTTNNTTI